MGNWFSRSARQLRHRFRDQRTRQVLPAAMHQRIGDAIAESDRRHTGLIRVYVESALPWSYIRRDAPVRERAIMQFSKLRVWDTEENNGVLIYLLQADRAIEIVADRALARAVQAAQWQALVQQISQTLRSQSYEAGLLQAVEMVASLLEQHFPPAPSP
ncbi:MAG: TPM domain-containing protein [Comamonas sp.]